MVIDRRVAAVAVQDQHAAEPAPVRGAEDVLHRRDQRGDAQAERAGIVEKIMGEAEIKWRRDQHTRLLRSGIRQGERNLDVGQQAQISMLFARAEHQHQAVVLREVFFHVHPV